MGTEALAAPLLSSAVTSVSATSSASTAGGAQTSHVSAADVSRFNALLSAPSSLQAQPPGHGVSASPPVTLGDAILQNLQRRASAIQKDWSTAQGLLAQEPLSASHLVRVQYAVLSASVQYDLVGKGISKASQDLDQLLRTQ